MCVAAELKPEETDKVQLLLSVLELRFVTASTHTQTHTHTVHKSVHTDTHTQDKVQLLLFLKLMNRV